MHSLFNGRLEQLKRIDFTLDSLLESQIPLEMKPPLNERVQRLVGKWAAVLIATLPIMRWGWQKDGFLTYLSGHNGRLLVLPALPRSVFTDFAYTFFSQARLMISHVLHFKGTSPRSATLVSAVGLGGGCYRQMWTLRSQLLIYGSQRYKYHLSFWC